MDINQKISNSFTSDEFFNRNSHLDLSYLKKNSAEIPGEVWNIGKNQGIPDDESILSILREFKESKLVEILGSKIFVVGCGSTGKTSIIGAMQGKIPSTNVAPTDGVNISSMGVGDDNLKISFWDFGGQDQYLNTHRFLFSKSSVVLYVWKPKEGSPESDNFTHEYWLDYINLLGNGSKIIIVSTHKDILSGKISNGVVNRFKKSIFGQVAVSSTTLEGVDELKSMILECKKSFSGGKKEMVPEKFKTIIDLIIKKSNLVPIMRKNDLFQELMKNFKYPIGVYNYIIELMDKIGTVLLIRDFIVLDVNWLNSIFTMIITADPNKKHYVDDGYLHHEKLPWEKIIEKSPKLLTQKFILELLYELSIAIPIKNNNLISLIPARLPLFDGSLLDYNCIGIFKLVSERFQKLKMPYGLSNTWVSHEKVLPLLNFKKGYNFNDATFLYEKKILVLWCKTDGFVKIYVNQECKDPQFISNALKFCLETMRSCNELWDEAFKLVECIPCQFKDCCGQIRKDIFERSPICNECGQEFSHSIKKYYEGKPDIKPDIKQDIKTNINTNINTYSESYIKMKTWKIKDVLLWINSLTGLSKNYSTLFQQNEINGRLLFNLYPDDLDFVDNQADREKIYESVELLKK